MATDPRESRTVISGYSHIKTSDGNGGEVISLRGDETLAPDYIRVRYSPSASAETVLTLFDADEYDGGPSSDDDWDAFILSPGDEVVITDATYDDVSDGVVAELDGNQDGAVVVSVGGIGVTA